MKTVFCICRLSESAVICLMIWVQWRRNVQWGKYFGAALYMFCTGFVFVSDEQFVFRFNGGKKISCNLGRTETNAQEQTSFLLCKWVSFLSIYCMSDKLFTQSFNIYRWGLKVVPGSVCLGPPLWKTLQSSHRAAWQWTSSGVMWRVFLRSLLCLLQLLL